MTPLLPKESAHPATDTMPLGTHYLVGLRGADPARLNDPDTIVAVLHALCARVQLTVLAQAVHHFNPQGVTAVLLLAESHVALHTWPEYGQAALDLFSCRADGSGEAASVRSALNDLAQSLGAVSMQVEILHR